MLLTCDIGNTNIKTGLFNNDKLAEFQIFSSLEDFISYLKIQTINDIAISSVVPAKLNEIVSKLSPGIKHFIISKDLKFNLELNYASLETLGIDRLCSCEGAFHLYKNSNEFQNYNKNIFVITIDFGTATTINIIKFPGEFLGGTISPGIKTMIDSLNSKTAQLPKIEAGDYESLIGRTTKQSIASGVINSTLGLIEKTINFLRKENNAEEVKIFLTGGNAEQVLPYFNFDFRFEKGLVLYGVKSVYDKNNLL